MKPIRLSNEKIPRYVYTALLSLAGALLVLLTIGTFAGLARSKDAEPLITLGKQGRTVAQRTGSQDEDIRVFSGLGRLRIPLSNSSILILSIAFPYPANDIAFTEELAGKIGEFRTIATDYFSALPEDALIFLNEEAAKTEILRRYNNTLRLGRISALYFNDLMIIDATY